MTKHTRLPELDEHDSRWFMDDRGYKQPLGSIMEFDHVIRVNPDGSIEDAPFVPDIFAPELNDGELEGSDWTLVGHSSQQGGGQIMHNSESIGGELADEILSNPGYYVAIVNTVSAEDSEAVDKSDEGTIAEGWAVAYRPGS